MHAHIQFNPDAIKLFCQKWRIVELALFGSVLREDFRPESDVDVLVTFAPDAPWSYWEWPDMVDELRAIFGRPVDLVERRSVTNPWRKHHILHHQEVVYAA
jgi:predicted nucleotidyltransferase